MIDYTKTPGREKLDRRNYKDYQKVISIITPSWNASEKIFTLANAILNQTFPYFEWLIIDDGSTKKDSLVRYRDLEKLDSRINVLHKKNEGPSLARDYGVKVSSKETKYVLFIDDDDLLDPTYLECAYFSMCMNPDASWCYSDVLNFGDMNTNWNRMFSTEQMKVENLLTCTALVKKEAFHEVGGFKLEGNGYYEDWVFWLKLLAKKRFPIHMSFYGFWYHRSLSSGEFHLANENHERNMEQIKEYAKKIKENVTPIEFPRSNYDWDEISRLPSSVVIPKFEKEKKKHILMIVPWMILGGADKFNIDFIKRIDKEKYRVTLVSTQPTEYLWRQQFEDVCEEVFDLSSFLDRQSFPAFIKYLIESREIDLILNTNSQYGYVMLPYIRANYPEIPIMDYIHMEEWYNRNGGYSRDSAAVGSITSKTLFCNQNSEQIMIDYFKRDPKSVGTVYIGVDTEKYDPEKFNKEELKEKYQIPNDKTIVTFIARIDVQKRPYLFMEIVEETLRKDSDFYFVVAGDGPHLKKIKSIASKKRIKNIKFLGSISKTEEIYAISDITLNCSIKEGLALTAYESLSMGVPVVSADVGGQKELISKEVGVIVPCIQKETDIYNFQYSYMEIENYVNGLFTIKNNLDTYKKNARKRILNQFDLQSMAKNMQKEMSSVMKQYKKDTSLTNHMDVTKELMNYYLLQDKGTYDWLVSEYNRVVYGKVDDSHNTKLQKLLWKYQNVAVKLHLPEESMLLYHFLQKFIVQLKNLIVAIFMIPYLILRFIIDFIILEGRRIVRIIKRKLVRK